MAQDGQEPQPGAGEPNAQFMPDHASIQESLAPLHSDNTLTQESGSILNMPSVTEGTQPTPEEQNLIDAREQTIEYAQRMLELTGVDGKRVPKNIAVGRIKNLADEADQILFDQFGKLARGEPTSAVTTEQGLLLSLIAQDAMYRAAQGDINNTDFAAIIARVHADSSLTANKGFDWWTKLDDPRERPFPKPMRQTGGTKTADPDKIREALGQETRPDSEKPAPISTNPPTSNDQS